MWEQHLNTPVPRGCGGGGGLQGSRPEQNSAASSAHSPGAAYEFFFLQGFSQFSPTKSARLGPHSGSELSADFTSSTPTSGWMRRLGYCPAAERVA